MTRILFVDDEANVLHAMRVAMRDMRHEWEMEFATSGPEALKLLAQRPADVIVSDMRMPGMDGWQLLQETKAMYPDMVRLVLSGYAEPGAIMRLVGTAHQYIAKPGNSESLKAAIVQTHLVRALLKNQALVTLVGHVGTLPTFPKTLQDISNCLRQPRATVADAGKIIGRDVAMTANIMKLVNSAFFGARRQVTSIDRAVAYLGFDTLTALVLAHGLFQSGPSVAIEGLWQHSLRTALAARAIAMHEKWPGPRVDEAFLAGMLHDVGRVVFATRKKPEAATGMTVGADSGSGTDAGCEEHHAEVGAYLLGLWGFPSHIVAAVALHHLPGQSPHTGFDLTVLVHVANRLVQPEVQGGQDAQTLGVEGGVLESLGLTDHLPAWAAAINSLSMSREAS